MTLHTYSNKHFNTFDLVIENIRKGRKLEWEKEHFKGKTEYKKKLGYICLRPCDEANFYGNFIVLSDSTTILTARILRLSVIKQRTKLNGLQAIKA